MLELFAPAKINLGLAVTGKRENGYHELDTIFVALDVGDRVQLARATSGIELTVSGANLPVNRSNLVFRAAEAYAQASRNAAGVRIHLEKRLPLAAGLGGGSSDAAATLRGMAQLFPADLDLSEIAVKLGADVPFFLEDGPRRAQGIGEVFAPVTLPRLHLVLANPGVGISAKEAYVGLNGRFGPPLAVADIMRALKRLEPPPYRNDLELPVLEAYPVVARVKRALERVGLFGVLMSGSGSTCFGLARNAAEALEAARQVQALHQDWWVEATTTQWPSYE